jgi:hypothetical protein
MLCESLRGIPYGGWIGFAVFILAHYIGDFVLQSRKIATEKSSSILALSIHVAIYTATILVFSFLVDFTAHQRSVFVIYNGLLHFITDYISSRVTEKAWSDGNIEKFWDTIGFDQFAHIYSLYVIYGMLMNND